jgi:hypothetical protein
MDARVAKDFVESAAATAAVGRLISLGLGKRYPALLAYISLLAISNFIYGGLDWKSELYFWTWLSLIPLECLFSILAVRELFALVFDNYAGIRTVGRWSIYVGIVLATGVSVILTGFSWSGAAQGRAHSHFFYWELSQRSVVFALSVVIFTILFVLSKYPIDLTLNTRVCSVFFSALFLSEAVRLLIDSLAPKLQNYYVDWAESIFAALCLVGWAALLQPEKAPIRARITFPTLHEDHLLKQLESLNQLMGRAARR